DEPQMQRAVTAWFPEETPGAGTELWGQIRTQCNIRAVLGCPLLLRLACQVAEEAVAKGRPLPRWERRTELYEAFLEDTVDRWAAREGTRVKMEQGALFLDFTAEVA